MTRTVLLDADSAGYLFAFRNSAAFDWGGGVVSEALDEDKAVDGLKTYIEELKSDLKADRVIVALTDYDSPCFRKKVYPDYKKNRHSKPKLLAALRRYMQDNYDCYIRPTLEADDVVGILATHPRLVRGEKIVVSIDKDLQSVPCTLYNPDKPSKPRKITQDDADLFFFTQVLTGDPVDTYPGCPGVGPKKAEHILGGLHQTERWPAVVAAYKERGLTGKDALVQARCARILRWEDYDYQKKRPKLWQPPKR